MKAAPWTFLVLAASGALLLASCKQPSTSSAQSLDNYTRGAGEAINPNECHGSFQDPVESSKLDVSALAKSDQAEFSGHLRTALTAIPVATKRGFFEHGSIRLLPDADAECRTILSGADKEFASEGRESSPIDACWDLRSFPNVTIVMSAKQSTIAHSTVRLFAFLHTKIFTRLIDLAASQGKVDDKSRDANVKFIRSLRLLPYALLEDAARDKSINVEHVKKILGSGSPSDVSGLQDAIYAETFDSRYCNEATRSVLEKKFPTASLVFRGDERTLDRLEAGLQGSRSGFGLADETFSIAADDRYRYSTLASPEGTSTIATVREGQTGNDVYSYSNPSESYTRTTPVFAGGVRGFSYASADYANPVADVVYTPFRAGGNAVSWAGNQLYGMWYGR